MTRVYADDDLDELRRHVEACDRHPLGPADPFSDEDRERVERRFIELAEERGQRVREHGENLARTARWLGREVACHRVTLTDAERRLDALAGKYDPETPVPLMLIPYREAVEYARGQFRLGFEEGSRVAA